MNLFRLLMRYFTKNESSLKRRLQIALLIALLVLLDPDYTLNEPLLNFEFLSIQTFENSI